MSHATWLHWSQLLPSLAGRLSGLSAGRWQRIDSMPVKTWQRLRPLQPGGMHATPCVVLCLCNILYSGLCSRALSSFHPCSIKVHWVCNAHFGTADRVSLKHTHFTSQRISVCQLSRYFHSDVIFDLALQVWKCRWVLGCK